MVSVLSGKLEVSTYLLYADDMTIKLWDWDAKWALKQTFEGHIHYVMQIVFNPKDNNTFASASLDRTVKVDTFEFVLLAFTTCSLGLATRIHSSKFYT